MFQGMIDRLNTSEHPVRLSNTDKENLYFQILLTQNHYTNFNSFHICFPINIKKRTNTNVDIDDDMITVNNFLYTG